jgi:hypothetical protein
VEWRISNDQITFYGFRLLYISALYLESSASAEGELWDVTRRLNFCLSHNYRWFPWERKYLLNSSDGDRIKGGKNIGACSTHVYGEECVEKLVWKPEKKRTNLRLRRREDGNISTDFKALGIEDVDCVHMAQFMVSGRVLWRRKKPQSSIKCGVFLDYF